MARFSVSQLVKAIDQGSAHHDFIGSVTAVASMADGSSCWLRFDPNTDGWRFREEQLEAAATGGDLFPDGRGHADCDLQTGIAMTIDADKTNGLERRWLNAASE